MSSDDKSSEPEFVLEDLRLETLDQRLVRPGGEATSKIQDVAALVFDQLPGAAAVVDADGRIVAVNAAWRRVMSGCSSNQNVGASYTDECERAAARGSDGAAETLAGMQAVLGGESEVFRTIYACPVDGRMHWYEARIWPVVGDEFRGAVVVHEDVTDEEEARRRVRALAHTDPLTELVNRRGLQAALQRLASGEPASTSAVYVLLDFDGFKAVNDRFGHDTGDRVLVIAARRLRHAVRAGDTVARMGGDEFVVLMLGACNRDERLQSLLARLEAPMRIGTEVLRIRASYGAAAIVGEVPPLEDLHQTADVALYRMKHAHLVRQRAEQS